MEQKIETRKKIMKAVIWIAVILALMVTAHLAVNNIDGLEFIKKLHGG